MRRIGRQNFGENNRRIYTANRESRVTTNEQKKLFLIYEQLVQSQRKLNLQLLII